MLTRGHIEKLGKRPSRLHGSEWTKRRLLVARESTYKQYATGPIEIRATTAAALCASHRCLVRAYIARAYPGLNHSP